MKHGIHKILNKKKQAKHKLNHSVSVLPLFIFTVSLVMNFLSCRPVERKVEINGMIVLTEEFIYEEAPFPSCHASTIAETPAGLVAAWFGGTHERHEDVEIWISSKVEGKWTAPRSVADGVQDAGNRYPCWNPVLYKVPGGELMLFYKVGPSPREWWGMLKTSKDNGKTWSDAIKLPENILGPVKNKPVMVDGRLLCPSSTEHDGWRVHFEITEDLGKSWKVAALPDDERKFNIIQPSILIHPGNKLQILARSRENYVISSWSEDGGFTWTDPEPTFLPNPNSGTDAVTLQNGLQLIVYNHSYITEGRWGGARTPLKVAVSVDGTVWETVLVLEDDPGEFSYPAVIQGDDGTIHITYTWNRERIKYVALDHRKLDYQTVQGRAVDENKVKHLKIFHEPGRFGGWPANHGIWSWDDEILVGFCAAWYQDRGTGHHVNPEKPEHHVLARSMDGGDTWKLEYPEEQKALLPRGAMLFGTPLPDVEYPPITGLKTPINFAHPDLVMTFRMEDHRGPGQSRFYYSYDRGRNWEGPYELPLFDTPGIAARTDYIVESENEMLVFLTAGKADEREGRTLVVKTSDGGLNWDFLSWIGPEPDGFRIMPSSVRLSDNEILTTVRRREGPRRWIKSWLSADQGHTWKALGNVATDVAAGSPPGLVKLRDGRLIVTYARRGEPFGMRARISVDNGRTWSYPIILRSDGGSWDIGYPVSVQRSDGKIVTIYYYWDEKTGPERYIAATIWDPDNY
jgi:predicted neuraminidase